jgi:beta-phosphoglucomutase
MAAGMTGAVLWDLDGTLVDSEEYHWRAWRETMAAEAVAITREQFLASFGQRNDSIVPQLLGRGASAERVERIGEAKEECYRRLVRGGGLAPSPGAAEWVKRLQADGWLQAIASSGPRRNVEVVLEELGFTGYFQAIVSAEDVLKGKPDPEVFVVAASRLGVPASRCVVVEDAAAGIEAARRAGMRNIGLSPSGAELAADLVVPSLAALTNDAFCRLLEEAALPGGRTGWKPVPTTSDAGRRR